MAYFVLEFCGPPRNVNAHCASHGKAIGYTYAIFELSACDVVIKIGRQTHAGGQHLEINN